MKSETKRNIVLVGAGVAFCVLARACSTEFNAAKDSAFEAIDEGLTKFHQEVCQEAGGNCPGSTPMRSYP